MMICRSYSCAIHRSDLEVMTEEVMYYSDDRDDDVWKLELVLCRLYSEDRNDDM